NNRSNCDNNFQTIFNECKDLMEELDIDIKIPRITGKQNNRSNPSNVNSCEEFYKITIFIPLLDDITDVLFESEIELWYTKWIHYKGNGLPSNIRILEVIDECSYMIYPNISSLLHILASLPISVATAERSFSTLRRLKTWLRAKMGEERLTGMALLNIHRNIEVDVESIIDQFSK
ncbi:52 kDa repressor of the inhibitor of the protein kinase-like isoform X2, partial [Aphis craccivora]